MSSSVSEAAVGEVPHTRGNPPVQLHSLQALRGVAALLVMLYHTGTLYAIHTGQVFMHNAFRSGFTGVDIFFVLSGVVIFWAHDGDLGKPSKASRFVVRRAFRLLPLYWAVVLLKVLKDPAAASATTLATAIFLIPTAAPYINVSWTLSYEALFYALFLLMIVLPRGPWSLCPVVAMVVLAFVPAPQAIGTASPTEFALFLFNSHLLEFVFGLTVAWALRHLRPLTTKTATVMVALGVAAFLSSAMIGTTLSPQGGHPVSMTAYEVAELRSNAIFDAAVFSFGAPAALAIAGMVALEMRGRFKFPWRRPLVWLGDISYSLYLTHGFVIHLMLSRAGFNDFATRHSWSLVLAWVIALPVAWICYRVVEVPSMRLGRRFSATSRS